MGGAQLRRQDPARGVGFDHDDGRTALNHRAHDGAQTHRAATEHQQAGARLAGEGAHDGADAGLDATAQRPEQFERRIVGRLDHVSLVGERVGRQGRLAKEVAGKGLTTGGDRLAAIGSSPRIVQGRHGMTVRGQALLAVGALAARAEGDGHTVSRRDLRHFGSDLLDHARAFVAQHRGQRNDRACLGDDVGVAEADADDADQDLVRTRIVQLDGLDREVGERRAYDGGLNIHSAFPRETTVAAS